MLNQIKRNPNIGPCKVLVVCLENFLLNITLFAVKIKDIGSFKKCLNPALDNLFDKKSISYLLKHIAVLLHRNYTLAIIY